MKSLVELSLCVVADSAATVGADLSRDVETIRERVEHEGDSFLTITLPAFCSDFERNLADGRIGSGTWRAFRKLRTGHPAFLGGLLTGVFDESGKLRDEPRIDCIRAIRQICLFAKKLKRPCSEARILEAMKGFIKCDDGLVPPTGQLWRYFGYVADVVVSTLPGVVGLEIQALRPKHGPKGTQERISGNQKWRFKRWHRRIEDAGFTRAFFARGSKSDPTPEEEYVPPELIAPDDEAPVKVCFVMKTLKSPRVIAVEPVCMQYAQQALKRLLVDDLHKSPLTRNRINFSDQSKNQDLALRSSVDGSYATVDMSEASDRVGLWHALRLWRTQPRFSALVDASRTMRAKLPTGQVIALRKFASMGSALCFPVEAMTFFVSVVASRLLRAKRFPDARSIHDMSRDVYVYGDDLIFPADEAPAICADLESLGFKINSRKSFWTGKFRESCGTDAYDGHVITPVYLRSDLPSDRKDVSRLLSSVSTANQLCDAGYPRTAAAIRDAVENVLGRLPRVPLGSPAIGWTGEGLNSPLPAHTRWNKRLQRKEFRAFVAVPVMYPDPLDGDAALAKCLLQHGSSEAPIGPLDINPMPEDHLEVSSMPYAIRLQRTWVPAH